MSTRNLRHRAERIASAISGPQPCRCERAQEPPRKVPPGCVVVERREPWCITTRCNVCGGEYRVEVVEVVVARADEVRECPDKEVP